MQFSLCITRIWSACMYVCTHSCNLNFWFLICAIDVKITDGMTLGTSWKIRICVGTKNFFNTPPVMYFEVRDKKLLWSEVARNFSRVVFWNVFVLIAKFRGCFRIFFSKNPRKLKKIFIEPAHPIGYAPGCGVSLYFSYYCLFRDFFLKTPTKLNKFLSRGDFSPNSPTGYVPILCEGVTKLQTLFYPLNIRHHKWMTPMHRGSSYVGNKKRLMDVIRHIYVILKIQN